MLLLKKITLPIFIMMGLLNFSGALSMDVENSSKEIERLKAVLDKKISDEVNWIHIAPISIVGGLASGVLAVFTYVMFSERLNAINPMHWVMGSFGVGSVGAAGLATYCKKKTSEELKEDRKHKLALIDTFKDTPELKEFLKQQKELKNS